MGGAGVAIPRPGADIAKWAPRAVVIGFLGFVVLVLPAMVPPFWAERLSRAVIFAIIALSLNVLIGYAGQISLGHQGFMGVGAFTSAYMVSSQGQTFWVGLVAAAVTGALASLIMGLVALRVRGLYLALVTLVYGRMAEESLFSIPAFGGGAGIEAPRPDGFTGENAYYYLCLAALAVVLFVDWRLTQSKAGRAINALRENEQVAASYAINVRNFKLLAFVISGVYVGIAGALFAHRTERVVGADFSFTLALTFVLMTVVGGLRSRTGVVIGGAFFALLRTVLGDWFDAFHFLPEFAQENSDQLGAVIGAVLLIVTLIQFPGGIAQQIKPITRWLRGGKFSLHGDADDFVEEGVRGRP